MAHLGKTIARLSKLKALRLPDIVRGSDDRLTDMADFGGNPGALRALTYVPATLSPQAPLVVVLHGCTQNAAAYDHGSGWSQLADEHGFALLFPEQQRANNPNLCFNWFSPVDIRRESGEALSIRQMVSTMIARHDIDPRRVFVTGLSAGGAMACVMLATYPEVFAGGAIIAGLPFGAARSVPDALSRMRGQGYPDDAHLAQLVRDASGAYDGPWPSVAVWQGSADGTVDPSNADRIVAQWRGVHGIDNVPANHDVVDGCKREFWPDATGRPIVLSYTIAGMGHGTPLQIGGAEGCGASGPYMLDVGISSTRHIARSWALLPDARAGRTADTRPEAAPVEGAVQLLPKLSRPIPLPDPAPDRAKAGVGAIIEDALRAAGLMR